MGKIKAIKKESSNVIRNVIYMLLFVSISLLGFGLYTYKILEANINFDSNSVSYQPSLSDTNLKPTN
jgi:hypothetical protein